MTTKETKHTPGPWKATYDADGDHAIFSELLEALKAVMAKFIGERQFATAEETAIVNQAREAIAKATGISG